VAVNADRRESDLRQAEDATLERWRRSASGAAGATGAAPAITASEPIELWRALLIILALVLIGESALGNWRLSPEAAT